MYKMYTHRFAAMLFHDTLVCVYEVGKVDVYLREACINDDIGSMNVYIHYTVNKINCVFLE